MITSLWEDIKETIFPIAHAEEEESDAPEEQESTEDSEEPEEDAEQEATEDAAEEAEDEDDDDEDDDDDDDDDEEEMVDPLVTLREKYTNTVCHDFKHHFDECTQRVTAEMERDDYEELEFKEDCVEEFFHLQHCLDDNTAKTLFSKLK